MLLYIDPGTGSMLFTILIGVFGAAVYFFRGLFMKVKFIFSRGKLDKTMNDKLSKFRTYLYQHLASKHHTELKAIKDTRREDEYKFKIQKEIYQLKMRAILGLWLIIGVIIFGGVVFHARRRNRLF